MTRARHRTFRKKPNFDCQFLKIEPNNARNCTIVKLSRQIEPVQTAWIFRHNYPYTRFCLLTTAEYQTCTCAETRIWAGSNFSCEIVQQVYVLPDYPNTREHCHSDSRYEKLPDEICTRIKLIPSSLNNVLVSSSPDYTSNTRYRVPKKARAKMPRVCDARKHVRWYLKYRAYRTNDFKYPSSSPAGFVRSPFVRHYQPRGYYSLTLLNHRLIARNLSPILHGDEREKSVSQTNPPRLGIVFIITAYKINYRCRAPLLVYVSTKTSEEVKQTRMNRKRPAGYAIYIFANFK